MPKHKKILKKDLKKALILLVSPQSMDIQENAHGPSGHFLGPMVVRASGVLSKAMAEWSDFRAKVKLLQRRNLMISQMG